MKNFRNSFMLLILVAIVSSGCLTYEKKEYKFELKSENSGTLTIKYFNIMSIMDDTLDVSEDDFDVLISEYLNGDKIENSFPGAQNITKRLFEENGVLCGEVTMDFTDIKDVRLFKYNDLGPLMFNMINLEESEVYKSSDGKYGGEIMPVVFWDGSSNSCELSTELTLPDNTCVGLLSRFKSWSEAAK
ncbi:MAG: hypothetical protein K8R41_01800 [Bacteroidales bacterium]|nr:hypothetical protein [Bacteroidales bacterium]